MSQFHLTFSKRFHRTSIAWIIRAVLPFLISWCEIWSKTAMFFGPVDWALGTIYMVWDDEHCQKPTKIDGHPRIPSRLLQGFSHSLLLYNINSAIFCRYFHTSIIHKIWENPNSDAHETQQNSAWLNALVTALCAACTEVVDGSLRISWAAGALMLMAPTYQTWFGLWEAYGYTWLYKLYRDTIYFIIICQENRWVFCATVVSMAPRRFHLLARGGQSSRTQTGIVRAHGWPHGWYSKKAHNLNLAQSVPQPTKSASNKKEGPWPLALSDLWFFFVCLKARKKISNFPTKNSQPGTHGRQRSTERCRCWISFLESQADQAGSWIIDHKWETVNQILMRLSRRYTAQYIVYTYIVYTFKYSTIFRNI